MVCATVPAHAQRSQHASMPIELGIDGGIIFGLDAPRATVVTLPIQDFRIGFLVTDNVAIEPRFNLNSIHVSGATVTSYNLELGIVYQPAGDRVGKGLYGRPFIGVNGDHVTGQPSTSNGYLGLGVGVKIPFSDRRLATRMEANYAHGFNNGGGNLIGLLFGLSFFTR
jgi:hypothetical protein